MFGELLSHLGGRGPILLVASLCAGLASRPLAHFGYSIVILFFVLSVSMLEKSR